MGAWPKRVFEQIGGFDEELVRDQDDEFNYRLRENGGRILLNPKIQSTYTNRSNPRALWKQYYQYGFYKVRVLQKHPRQMRPRQFIPLIFVISILLSVLAVLLFHWGMLLFSLVAGSYLVANLVASLMTASKKSRKYLPLLPICFLILHLSYGSGFLTGLFKFWNRWGDKKGKAAEFNPAPAD